MKILVLAVSGFTFLILALVVYPFGFVFGIIFDVLSAAFRDGRTYSQGKP